MSLNRLNNSRVIKLPSRSERDTTRADLPHCWRHERDLSKIWLQLRQLLASDREEQMTSWRSKRLAAMDTKWLRNTFKQPQYANRWCIVLGAGRISAFIKWRERKYFASPARENSSFYTGFCVRLQGYASRQRDGASLWVGDTAPAF